jgi:RHS repeat-associated protein
VFSDLKTPITNNGQTVTGYEVAIIQNSDYSPFGAELDGRTTSGTYRRGFNGMEADDEAKGDGNSYDFGARMYDARVGRWLNPDLKEKKYAYISPYTFTNNNPIILKDFDGNDWGIATKINANGSKSVTIILNAAVIDETSSHNIDMNAFKGAVKTQVNDSYSITYEETVSTIVFNNKTLANDIKTFKRTVNVIVQTNIRVISDKSDLQTNEHLLSVLDKDAATAMAGGHEIYGKATGGIGGTEIIFSANKVLDMMNGKDNNTIPHELGHTFGLRHLDKPNETLEDRQLIGKGKRGNPQSLSPKECDKIPDNAMFSGSGGRLNDKTSTKLEPGQIKLGIKQYKNGKLNKH